MILSLPERLADFDQPLYVHASIELPSAVVSVQVRPDTMAPLRDVVQQGLTLEQLERAILYDSPRSTTSPTLADLGPVVSSLLTEIRARLTANHVIPVSLDGFVGLYDRLPCLCGDFYAPIDAPCSACAVVMDLALEHGLVEYAEMAPLEGDTTHLRWAVETLRGGRVLRGDRGWDWSRMREMRDENVYSTAIVAPPYPTRASNRKAKKQRPQKLAHCKRKR